MTLAFYISILSVSFVSLLIGSRLYEASKTNEYIIILVTITTPVMFGFLLFPIHFLLSNIFAIFYSNKYLNTNSQYFAAKPIESSNTDQEYPFLTIQVPIYDENFATVIRPMLINCIKVRQGYPGLCNIVVNDDGIFKFIKDDLDVLSSNYRVLERIRYYKKHNIAFTARKYGHRFGKFKKASNMNFGYSIVCSSDDVCINDHDNILNNIVINYEKKYMYYGNIDIGEFIILIDSDSTLPNNFLHNTLKMFMQEDRLAYTQHYTKPLESSYQNYFSKYIAEYTTNLYEVIFRISTCNGDICPLIGHNIILRKEALEKVAIDGKYWMENRVSEDFDLCLRLHNVGYYGKYVLVSDIPFGEGVSLVYEDEINKYSKFAYGASEIMFEPIKKWYYQSPFTKTFKNFILTKHIPFSSKIGILSYLLTYFSIASGVLMSPVLAIISCYIDSWELIFFNPLYAIMFLIIIFSFIAPLSNVIVKKHLGINFSYIREIFSGIFFFIFYSGVSWSIFVGIFCHLCSINISWGSTVKTLEEDSRRVCFVKILKNRYNQINYSFCMIFIGFLVYFLDNCRDIYSLLPVFIVGFGHLFTPFILTPSLFSKDKYEFPNLSSPRV